MAEEPCIPCLIWYAPQTLPSGLRQLSTINDYFIDFRLKEFRKVVTTPDSEAIKYVSFQSQQGKALFRIMHKCRIRRSI